jgi:hypothetical protein
MPKRIQMTRQRPWRHEHPDAVIVARPGPWGNPFRVGETQLRSPRIDGREGWEIEDRLHKTSGTREPFHHSDYTLREDGSKRYRVTWHDVRDATLDECVALYREYVTGEHDLLDWRPRPRIDAIRAALAGRDLACWCPLDQPCHADVLLALANPKETT